MKTLKDIDWPAIERDYRTGQLSNRELGRQYGCSYEAIRKKAKAEDWEKETCIPLADLLSLLNACFNIQTLMAKQLDILAKRMQK